MFSCCCEHPIGSEGLFLCRQWLLSWQASVHPLFRNLIFSAGMWKIAWHSCHKIPFLVFLCFELSQFSLAQQLLSYQLQCLQKVIIVKPCRHLVKCQHWWVWAPPELLLKILLIHLGMHVKALMSFTSHAISKWIAIIIYLWTTIFYLEKCSLWLVFWDEPLLSVFLEQLGTSVEWCRFWFCTSLKESKLIKHC